MCILPFPNTSFLGLSTASIHLVFCLIFLLPNGSMCIIRLQACSGGRLLICPTVFHHLSVTLPDIFVIPSYSSYVYFVFPCHSTHPSENPHVTLHLISLLLLLVTNIPCCHTVDHCRPYYCFITSTFFLIKIISTACHDNQNIH